MLSSSDLEVFYQTWEKYNQAVLAGECLNNQTGLFFQAIPSARQYKFINSNNTIIQLGIGNGDFLAKFKKEIFLAKKLLAMIIHLLQFMPCILIVLKREKSI